MSCRFRLGRPACGSATARSGHRATIPDRDTWALGRADQGNAR